MFGKEMLTLLAVCSFVSAYCICLSSLLCWGLDVDLIVLVPGFSYLLYTGSHVSRQKKKKKKNNNNNKKKKKIKIKKKNTK